jgi:hypothetical protein
MSDMSAAYICVQCGVQYAETPAPPESCRICEDERQFVNPEGQAWTTLEEIRSGHRNELRGLEPGLTAITTVPAFAIGQQALVVESGDGNVLWDCISLIDEPTIEAVVAAGGLRAIAISHPHFYDTMVEWSRALGDVPIYLHAADREWVMRPDPAIVFWEGETLELGSELTLIRCGGHFEGASVLHWAGGAEGRGVLLSSDTLHVTPDRRRVTFMRSFPNHIPLSRTAVEGIVGSIDRFAFDRIYGGLKYWRKIEADAKDVVRRSVERYTRAIES